LVVASPLARVAGANGLSNAASWGGAAAQVCLAGAGPTGFPQDRAGPG